MIFDDPSGLSIHISGFTGLEAETPSLANSDEIELTAVWTTTSHLTGNGHNLVVILTDGDDTAKLTFDSFDGKLNMSNDGTDTFIFDPPATNASSPTASQSNDSFVFHTGANGSNTGASWNTGTRDHAGWAHTQQEWSQLAGDMNSAVAADIASHAESHWHYALHSAEHLH